MVYKHRKAQLALFRPVSRERIGGTRTRPSRTKPTQPIYRSLWAEKWQAYQLARLPKLLDYLFYTIHEFVHFFKYDFYDD